MPTSVLLAVLAAAGLLALAPALVRRHDATERQVAERAQSTARVLPRQRRRRNVPGPRPVNPSTVLVPTLRTAAPVSPATPPGRAAASRAAASRAAASRAAGRARRRPARSSGSATIRRRRRVLAALLLLNLVKLVGVVVVGPGFWIGFAVTFTLLVVFVVHLRNLALADRRHRREEARRASEIAAQQAEVRREQQRRAAARREAARRMAEQRERLRRAAASGAAPPSVSYRPAADPRRSRAS